MRRLIATALFCALNLSLFAIPANRAALVVGNSAYASSPLANPVNDAADMAALLSSSGVEVVLRTDLDLAGFEKAVSEFVASLKGKESAIIFYAGHGVQVGGENYLIPVKEDIRSEAQARSRGLSLSYLLERVRDSGVKTVLVFLDACRDNPFPGSSRGGTRGLAVVSAPREVETLVAFATEPGDTAADGKGRNGVFTAALLKAFAEPGVNITEAMLKVRAEVLAASEGKQRPRVDMGLSRPWYLIDPEAAAAKAASLSARSSEELATLEREIAARQAAIDAARDDAKRAELLVEQQKQKAAQALKKQEAEALAKQAALKRQAAEAEARKQAEVAQAARAQDELVRAMAARRAELERLSKTAQAKDPDAMVEAVERLAAALAEIEGQFDAGWRGSEALIRASFATVAAAVDKAQPELWETDAEFAQRVKSDQAKLETDLRNTMASRKAAFDADRAAQVGAVRAQLDAARAALAAQVWGLPPDELRLTVGTYDRNARKWPFAVEGLNPVFSFKLDLVADFAAATDLRGALSALDQSAKAGALAPYANWGIDREESGGRYLLVLRSVGVRDLATGKNIVEVQPGRRVAAFLPGQRSTPITTATFTFEAVYAEAEVYLNGAHVGRTPLTLAVAPGNHKVEFRWEGFLPFIFKDQPADFGQVWNFKGTRQQFFFETINTGDASHPAGEFFMDGKKVGETPWKAPLPPGKHLFEIRWSDRPAAVLTGEFKTGESWTWKYDYSRLRIGDRGPAGGTIIYDKGESGSGWRYLEMAPVEFTAFWSNGHIAGYNSGGVNPAFGVPVTRDKRKHGYGSSNTKAIVKKYGPGNYAAKLCDDYSLNGYDDWFLPSMEELWEIMVLVESGDFLPLRKWYWTSTEDADVFAWAVSLSLKPESILSGSPVQPGNGFVHFKSRDGGVIPVRAFDWKPKKK